MVLVDDVITYNLSLGGATAGVAMRGGEDAAYGCGEGGNGGYTRGTRSKPLVNYDAALDLGRRR